AMFLPLFFLSDVVVIHVCVPKCSILSPIPTVTRNTNQNHNASQTGQRASEINTSIPPSTIIGLKPNFFIGFSMNGEEISTAIYKPVECRPLREEATPVCFNINAINGKSNPWEKQEIVTSAIKIQNLFFAYTIPFYPPRTRLSFQSNCF